jgi:hypothetical protein
MRSATEGAVEGMAMSVGKSGQRDPAKDFRAGLRFHTDIDSHKASVLHVESDLGMAAVW